MSQQERRRKRYKEAEGGGPRRGPGGPMHPGQKVKLKNAKGTIWRLLGYLKNVTWQLAAAFAAVILSTVAAIMAPRFSGRLIDALTEKDPAGMLYFLGIMAVCYVVSTLLSWAQSMLMVEVAQNTVRRLREDLFDKMQALSLRFFDSKPHGELMSRLTNDVDNVSNMLSNTITQVLSGAITLVGSLVMMLMTSPWMTLVALLIIPLSMTAIRSVTSRTGKMFKAQQAALGELNGIVEETVTGARVVKVFSYEKHVIADFDQANEDLTEAGSRATIFSGVMGPMMNFFGNFSYALVAGVGGLLAVRGMVSIGDIASFLQYSRNFTRPLSELANLITVTQSALAGAERVFEVMDTEPEPVDGPGAVLLNAPKGHVKFDDVTFGYSKDTPILKDVTFEALPGQTIALVGPTGAGKTTIVNLLMRFYDIDKGTVEIDGNDIHDIARQSLRDSLGMVLQDVYLFAGTVRDNIAYGKLNANMDEIISAAKTANCHEFITRLPKGYDTVISEDGGNLSQGQKQLLSIARAILGDPAVLILDEATSSVDTRTEMNIQAAMLNLMRGRTSFVIAHRLSTIRNADLILVIDGGRIIERGTHEDLIGQNGFYANMLNSQFSDRTA